MLIKNIIFDLGGVILNIDYRRTTQAFHLLGGENFDTIFTQTKQDKLIEVFEIGQISSPDFRQAVSEKLHLNVTDEVFDQAWNAMLLDLPQIRLDFIKNLKNKYKIFLFSNTNEIHFKHFCQIFYKEFGLSTLADYFDREYYSHLFGQRKPNPESFLSILNDSDLKAGETLFIDDSLQHIMGAKSAGLQAIHLTQDKSILDLVFLLK